MALSAAVQQAYARAGVNTLHLVAVEMNHPVFPAALRHVNYDKPVTVNSQTYTGIGMEVIEPEIGDEPSAALQLVIDGVSGKLNPLIAAANETDIPIALKLTPFAYDAKTDAVIGAVGSFDMEVRGAVLNMTTITIEAGFISPANQPFPAIRYSPDTHASLYQ